MKFTSRIKVTGLKESQGNFEGTAYDSTKVYVETALDESKGTSRGHSTVEYSYLTAAEYKKLQHIPLPFMADADMEIVTTGKVQKTAMIKLTPIEMVKAVPVAPGAQRVPA